MIITISREFGSGGRELGKRLADILGFDYYDKEIISKIADETGLHEQYIDKVLEQGSVQNTPLVFRRSFYGAAMKQSASTQLLVIQTKIIREIANTSANCIIVGRCADVILQEYHPFKIFVYADMEAKTRRCFERAGENEQLTKEQMIKKIKKIDKQRSQTRMLMASGKWGMKEEYNLMINTTGLEIKALTPVVAQYAKLYAGGNIYD